MAAAVHVGKVGIDANAIAAARSALGARELVKVRFPPIPPAERKAAIAELAKAVDAENVGGVGRNFLLYRPSAESAFKPEV